jgi:hypothetical protein
MLGVILGVTVTDGLLVGVGVGEAQIPAIDLEIFHCKPVEENCHRNAVINGISTGYTLGTPNVL